MVGKSVVTAIALDYSRDSPLIYSKAYLGVYYLEFTRTGLRLVCSAHQRDQRSAEEHLHNSLSAVICESEYRSAA